MEAIMTKFLGPTNSRGARIKAYTQYGPSVTIPFSYDGTVKQAHEAAARELANNRSWKGDLVGGETKEGYAFVFLG